MNKAIEVIAIEDCATDFLYGSAANPTLRDKFLKQLYPQKPPRKGENIAVSAEHWQQTLKDFARDHGLPASSPQETVASIFGKPESITAGGALANTFHTLLSAKINRVPITDGIFVTAIGEGESGEVFRKSLEGKLHHPPAQGIQSEAHVFPIDGDRIIVTLFSKDHPPHRHMSAQQLDEVPITAETKLVMLGGYTKYTGKYPEFMNAVIAKVKAAATDPARRPAIVLTTASQHIAASDEMKTALNVAREAAPVIVLTNAGEFRRLMGMDEDWRKPHKAKWWLKDGKRLIDDELHRNPEFNPNTRDGKARLLEAGWHKLEGEALETTEKNDADYNKAKLQANQDAYLAAYQKFCANKTPAVTFVVTNGGKGVHVVSHKGISENYETYSPTDGVKNPVGGGDAFAAGYLLGHLKGLTQEQSVKLGLLAGREVVGQDEARLKDRELVTRKGVTFSGLPAYLTEEEIHHRRMLETFAKGATLAR